MAATSTIQIAQMRTDRDVRDASLLLSAHRAWLRSVGVEPAAVARGGAADYADPAAFYTGRDGVLLLAEVDGRRVGMVALRRLVDRPDVAELRRMFVIGLLRGQGIGGQLLDTAVGHARIRGYDAVELRTRPRLMQRAHGLYLRAGFRESDANTHTTRFDLVTMSLALRERVHSEMAPCS